jgi:hypothetical protein
MGLIKFQPAPKVPPIGFFEPISVDPRDMMTDVEYLLGILKKLNSMIAQINSNTKFIEDYDGRIEVVEAEIKALRTEMTEFEGQINETITTRFSIIELELKSMIGTALNQANAYTDLRAEELEAEIQSIAIGQIMVYDPTTGYTDNLQNVIDNLYNSSRTDALTATEYDALELTATAYDGYELTAIAYDQSGKTLLTT